MSIEGLTALPRRELARVFVLYALIVAIVLAIPALAVHRRGELPHPTEQEVQPRGPTAPGR